MFAPPRERAGGKTARSSRALTPVSVRSAVEPALKRSSSAKENPRSASRVPAKPVVQQMARVDKVSVAAAKNGDGGDSLVRRSASSVPRGRSSSPSECIRVFNDRGSRVSGDKGSAGKSVSGVRSGSMKKSGFRDLNVNVNVNLSGTGMMRGLRDDKENAKAGVNSDKKKGILKKVDLGIGGSEKRLSTSRVMRSGIRAGEVKLSSQSQGSCGVDGNGGVRSRNDEGRPEIEGKTWCGSGAGDDCKEGSSAVLKVVGVGGKIGDGADLGLNEPFDKSMSTLKVSGGLDEAEGASESSVEVHANKYSSRLHEKLAFLEGKVKRIASDIKRTKEMLDMNNPDSSKVILSDIQEKISGLEKVVGNDNRDLDGKVKSLKCTVNCDRETQKSQCKQSEVMASSVKGLNGEELEARFFPHHKLLRNRTSSNTSSGISQVHEALVSESSIEPKVSHGPTNDGPVTLEFLASLDKERNKGIMRNGHADSVYYDVQEVDNAADTSSTVQDRSNVVSERDSTELFLTSDETIGDFDDQENKPAMTMSEEIEYATVYQLNDIECKTTTGGWFVSEGEAVLLAHDDNSCSFYDIANCEVKTEYKPPSGLSSNLWRDCWIIRAPSSDGCSGRYVVAASAGNTIDSGFCSWDYYTKEVQALHIEDGTEPISSRTVLGPLPNNTRYRRNTLSSIMVPETQQWWYKPSGPLIVSTASGQRVVKIYDIRDGEHIMKWDLQKNVSSMDYSSPLQWRNRGKVVVAEAEIISVWDVNSLTPQPLLSVPLTGQKISALHMINSDAEPGGGVRQRVSSSEADGHDGVFCTNDSIKIMDFRHPTGVGLKIPKLNVNAQSVFSCGDSVFVGCNNIKLSGKKQCSQSQVQQFSLRRQKLISSYNLPESNAHSSYTAITQVWGNSNLVMGVCGLGLFVFDALKDDDMQSLTTSSSGCNVEVRELIGPDDLYSPSFDYMGSRALLISRDRPAMWKYLSR